MEVNDAILVIGSLYERVVGHARCTMTDDLSSVVIAYFKSAQFDTNDTVRRSL